MAFPGNATYKVHTDTTKHKNLSFTEKTPAAAYLSGHVDDVAERNVDKSVIVFVQVVQQGAIDHQFCHYVHWLTACTDAHQLHQLTMPQVVHDLCLLQECIRCHRPWFQCFDGNIQNPTPFSCKSKCKGVNLYSASCVHASNALFVSNQSRRPHGHRMQPADTG